MATVNRYKIVAQLKTKYVVVNKTGTSNFAGGPTKSDIRPAEHLELLAEAVGRTMAAGLPKHPVGMEDAGCVQRVDSISDLSKHAVVFSYGFRSGQCDDSYNTCKPSSVLSIVSMQNKPKYHVKPVVVHYLPIHL